MSEREKLAHEIQAFIKRTGTTPTRMSVEIGSERGLIRRILDGSDCTLSKADAIRSYMREFSKKKNGSPSVAA
jgi:predicted transcriptional regulator